MSCHLGRDVNHTWSNSEMHTPNVVVKWLTLLRIREVPGLILGPGDQLFEVFRGFSQSLQANVGIVP
jgi:hypothetical protein